MSDDDDPLTVETDGETYADVRLDGELVAAVDVVDDDQAKVKPYSPQHPDPIDVWFVDRVQQEEDDE